MIREANICIQIIEKRVYIDIYIEREKYKCCGNLREKIIISKIMIAITVLIVCAQSLSHV